MADATTVTDTRQDLLAAGNTFGYIGQIHPGTATQELDVYKRQPDREQSGRFRTRPTCI